MPVRFPRHWIYDSDGALIQKSGVIDFAKWYREAHEQNTPWGNEDSAAVVTAVESALERDLSLEIMRAGGKRSPQRLSPGDLLVEQGETGEGSSIVYLMLDGVIEVIVDGEVVGELGPGAIVGERAQLEERCTDGDPARQDGGKGHRRRRRGAEPRGSRASRC